MSKTVSILGEYLGIYPIKKRHSAPILPGKIGRTPNLPGSPKLIHYLHKRKETVMGTTVLGVMFLFRIAVPFALLLIAGSYLERRKSAR